MKSAEQHVAEWVKEKSVEWGEMAPDERQAAVEFARRVQADVVAAALAKVRAVKELDTGDERLVAAPFRVCEMIENDILAMKPEAPS